MELLSGKMTSKGQITIPKQLRDKLNLNEGDQIKFLISDDELKIEPLKRKKISEVVGKIKVNEQVNLDKMRKVVQEKAAKEIVSEEVAWDKKDFKKLGCEFFTPNEIFDNI